VFQDDDLVSWMEFFLVKCVTNRNLNHLAVLKQISWPNRNFAVLLMFYHVLLALDIGVENAICLFIFLFIFREGVLLLRLCSVLLTGLKKERTIGSIQTSCITALDFTLSNLFDIDSLALTVLLLLGPFPLLEHLGNLEPL